MGRISKTWSRIPRFDMASLDTCKNGNCTKLIYRGRVCYRCWAGIKWTSINQRVANKNGNNPSYEGVPIKFTRLAFIQWVLDNPPPRSMATPSIDRIEPELGYAPGNIRWLDRRRNSAGNNRDVPDGQRWCNHCARVLPISAFGVNNGRKWGPKVQVYCRSCRESYRLNNEVAHGVG